MTKVDVEVPLNQKFLDMTIELPQDWQVKKYKLCVVLTHGAGGDKDYKPLVTLSSALCKAGFMCARFTCRGFNIKYRTRAYVEVVRYISQQYPALCAYILAGRSMGSRAALIAANCIVRSQGNKNENSSAVLKKLQVLHAKPFSSRLKKETNNQEEKEDYVDVRLCSECKATHPANCNIIGVICLAYPLHRPGSSDMRSQPILDTTSPVLFISGTSDEMCDLIILKEVITSMSTSVSSSKSISFNFHSEYIPTWKVFSPNFPISLVMVDNATHGLTVKGVNNEDVTNCVSEIVVNWISEVIQQ